MKKEGANIQATEAYEAERKKVEDARAALPDVETLLSLDELQVRQLLLSPLLYSRIAINSSWNNEEREKGKKNEREGTRTETESNRA